ncbi:hypothetical protein Tco_0090667, partial [Tanacetum coccineum]
VYLVYGELHNLLDKVVLNGLPDVSLHKVISTIIGIMTVEAAVSAWWERLCLSFQDLFRRFGFLNILIGIEEVTGSFSPLESDLGKSMALPHSLEKLPEDFLVEVEVLGVLILTLWKTQGQKAPQLTIFPQYVDIYGITYNSKALPKLKLSCEFSWS